MLSLHNFGEESPNTQGGVGEDSLSLGTSRIVTRPPETLATGFGLDHESDGIKKPSAVACRWPGGGRVHSLGTISSGESFLTEFTSVETGNAVISSAGYWSSMGSSAAGSVNSASSHRAYSAGERITGMRS